MQPPTHSKRVYKKKTSNLNQQELKSFESTSGSIIVKKQQPHSQATTSAQCTT